MGYIVSLRYTSKAGGFAGVITSTDFGTKDNFDVWFSNQNQQEVVEEGITNERAVQLTETTPIKCYLMSAVEEACDKESGELISEKLLMEKIQNVLWIASTKKVA